MSRLLVCELTEKYGWGGRVAIGHVNGRVPVIAHVGTMVSRDAVAPLRGR